MNSLSETMYAAVYKNLPHYGLHVGAGAGVYRKFHPEVVGGILASLKAELYDVHFAFIGAMPVIIKEVKHEQV